MLTASVATSAPAHLGAGKTQAGPDAPVLVGGACGSPAPSSPAGLGGVNHPSVCDSALALKEARPHADAWDIPGMGQGPKLWPGGGRKSLLDQASGLAP